MHEWRLGLEHEWYGRQAIRRYGDRFDEIRKFCLFVGYPRSGHSLVGAMLNAHRDAVIAHEANAPRLIDRGMSREALFGRLMARSELFHRRGNQSNYRYTIPNQWQGRFAALRVIGDKKGGAVTRRLDGDPEFLSTVRARVAVPLRLLHVVRHPLDNISAIAIWHRLSLDDSIDFYLRHARITARIEDLCGNGELLTVRHEDFFSEPGQVLERICRHLGLEEDGAYVHDCASVVFPVPTRTRTKVEWTRDRVARVEFTLSQHPHLGSYFRARSSE